ncbi:MAG: hypothetical protein KAJ42_11445 [Gemmatimonadetes bacterium]|nr:hypothetical protein [Gemmatimonadota bacterium]
MKRFLSLVILITLPVAGCGPFGGGPSPDAALAFGVPTPSSLAYLVGDTAVITIETGMMGTLEITSSNSATLGVDFAPAAGGVQVTALFREYSATQTNPMAGATTADQDDISGPLVFTLDRRGHGEIVQAPEVTGNAVQFFPSEYAYLLFPQLPGGALDPGDSWVDTVAYQMEHEGTSIAPIYAYTYTLQGDTTVAGRRLLKINAVAVMTVEMMGSTEGMELAQAFAGDMSGTVLWDPVGGMLYSSEMTRSATGILEIPAAGMPPMPLTVTGTLKVTLQGQ